MSETTLDTAAAATPEPLPTEPQPAPAPTPAPEPPPAPVPVPDPPSEPQAAPEPAAPTTRVTAPPETKGYAMVLWARKPARGDQDDRPRYQEVGYYRGKGLTARRAAMDDPANEYLRNSAAQKPGILLRAVPAQSWPLDVEATAFDRPAPKLIVR